MAPRDVPSGRTWRPMRATPLDSWLQYSARLLQTAPPAGDSPADKEARRVAREVCRATGASRERAERLAADCASRGETRTLLRVANEIGEHDLVPWVSLLDKVLQARNTKGGRRGAARQG